MKAILKKISIKGIIKISVTAVVSSIVSLFLVFLLIGGDLSRLPQQISLINKVLNIDTNVNDKAVYFNSDTKTVGDEIAKTYISMIDDQYAIYFTADEYKTHLQGLKGIATKSIGINISIKQGDKYPSIVYVHKNSPANQAGLKKGDKLLKINGVALKNQTTTKAAELIKEKDTATILLKRGKKKIEVNVKLDEFTLDSVIARMINDTCVIEITEFDSATVSQFDEALEFAYNNNAKALVFDLRDNPGGYVSSCSEILDKLCSKGDLVRTKNKKGEINVISTSDENEIKMPMALIVNENSASAAEVFAMNFRDYKKGEIIGVKTFGKGVAQTTYKLSDGSAVKFTTETVVDNNGSTYDKKGIYPDIEVELTDKKKANYSYLSDKDDSQLQKALETVKK